MLVSKTRWKGIANTFYILAHLKLTCICLHVVYLVLISIYSNGGNKPSL